MLNRLNSLLIISCSLFSSCVSSNLEKRNASNQFIIIGKAKSFTNVPVLDAGNMVFQGAYEFEILGYPKRTNYPFFENPNKVINLHVSNLIEIDSYDSSRKSCPSLQMNDDLYQVFVEKVKSEALSNNYDNYMINACSKFDKDTSEGFVWLNEF